MSCLENCFGTLPDPRANTACHSLSDLMVIMLAAVCAGLWVQQILHCLRRIVAMLCLA
jgi:hypothetical protein